MAFREMKTLHLKLTPQPTGFFVQHKKFNTLLGTVEITGADDLSLTCGVEDAALRAEALEAVQSAAFRETPCKTCAAAGAVMTREAWRKREAERFSALHKTAADYAEVLHSAVHCVMDRPLGSRHPRHPEMVYPVNYGYVPGVLAGDGSEQDVYILGVDVPIAEFDGEVVAVVHRFDDCEDKWVVAAAGAVYSEEEILNTLDFQERFYTSELIL